MSFDLESRKVDDAAADLTELDEEFDRLLRGSLLLAFEAIKGERALGDVKDSTS